LKIITWISGIYVSIKKLVYGHNSKHRFKKEKILVAIDIILFLN